MKTIVVWGRLQTDGYLKQLWVPAGTKAWTWWRGRAWTAVAGKSKWRLATTTKRHKRCRPRGLRNLCVIKATRANRVALKAKVVASPAMKVMKHKTSERVAAAAPALKA